MPLRTSFRTALLVLAASMLFAGRAPAATAHEPGALGGLAEVALALDGFDAEFVRYGLSEDTVRQRVTRQLEQHGLPVAATATTDRLAVRLVTNRDQYGFYHYAVSLSLSRRVPIAASATAHLRQEAWSAGEHGIVNPSDLATLYPVIERLLARFIDARANDNPARPLAPP